MNVGSLAPIPYIVAPFSTSGPWPELGSFSTVIGDCLLHIQHCQGQLIDHGYLVLCAHPYNYYSHGDYLTMQHTS